MATKKTNTKKAPATTPAKTPIESKPKNVEPHVILQSSIIQNSAAMQVWGKFAGDSRLADLVESVDKKIEAISAGDMGSVEAMLYGQAMTLQTMFTCLAIRASGNEGLKQYQCNLTLALKAQAQCRATLEALAEIKNPRPVSFVKQANFAHGPQQINNGTGTNQYAQAHAGAGDISSTPNKLLEADHGNYLDTRAPGAAGRANPHMATVG